MTVSNQRPDGAQDVGSGHGSAAPATTSNLIRRVLSAAVLGPITLAALYAGGWVFLLVCAAAAGIILCEWTLLVQGRADNRALAPGLAGLAAATILIGIGRPVMAIFALAAGGALAAILTAQRPGPQTPPAAAAWVAAGMVYAAIGLLGPTLLRRDPVLGFAALLFIFVTVWANDIFSYFGGKGMGGPLLWEAISPKKTWAGAIIGLAGGVVAGTLVAYASGVGRIGAVGVVALVLSILAQAGDLLESAVKRHFGAKDAGRLIPGHGGLMDRLDGLLIAVMAGLILGAVRQGTDAPAQGLLIW